MLLFWEHGYDNVGIRELAQAMNIRLPSLYAAFGDKPQLFQKALQLYSEQYGQYVQDAFEENNTSQELVKRLLQNAVIQQTIPDRPAGCLIMSDLALSPEASTIQHHRRDDITCQLQQRIQADIDAALLPSETSASVLTLYVLTVWQGLAQLARGGASRTDLQAVAALALKGWPSRSLKDTA